MGGESEVGKCECCGTNNVPLERKYFKYPVKCECHSPKHFEFIRHCKDCIPKEPEYTKVTIKTEELKHPVTMAMKIIKNELATDKSDGGMYFAWQSNIACAIADNSDINLDKANDIAKKFLELLIKA